MHTYTARTHSQTSTQVVPYASFSSGRKLSTSTWCGQRPSSSNAWASRAQMNYAQASMERADGKGRVIRRCDAIQSAPFEPVGARIIVIAHATRVPQASHVDVLDRHQTYKGKPAASHTTCSEVLPASTTGKHAFMRNPTRPFNVTCARPLRTLSSVEGPRRKPPHARTRVSICRHATTAIQVPFRGAGRLEILGASACRRHVQNNMVRAACFAMQREGTQK
jgi:hypothetical protein